MCSRRARGERGGDPARVQMAEKPPSTDNSTPFTKLESSEARNSLTVAISSGRPIFPRGLGAIAMEITKSGTQSSAKGPADWFTGSVRIDSPFQRQAPARIGGATVTFEPGARTAWHTHPLGQTLIVTAGSGRVQRDGEPIEEIRAGDIVWFEPGERHWHGAAPTTALTHIAIAEMLDGKAVEWMEHVTEEQYGG